MLGAVCGLIASGYRHWACPEPLVWCPAYRSVCHCGSGRMDGEPASQAVLPAGSELGFAALLLLFAASLLTVLVWLLQVARWSRPAQPGARGLLSALCSFPSIRDSWSTAWAQALNREAVRSRSSVQMMFEENLTLQPNVHISQVYCTKHSDSNMVFLCHLSADTVRFPVSVTQESPAAVSCDTYQVSVTIQSAQIEVRLQELEQAGLLVSWSFKERPDMLLHVVPKHHHQTVVCIRRVVKEAQNSARFKI